ncbi:MAG: GTPase HflX [Planctomycetota bacterium]|nr:GTPase HflX [Planctomycetota bacterium]
MKLDTAPKIRRDRGQRERAILVGVQLPGEPTSYRAPLEELSDLADTAGADTLDRIVQRRETPDPRTFMGKGKAEEVGRRLKELDADLVIFDHDLSPSQARNLEKVVGGRVIDRTELILDIFVRRASSAMARAQVELAQMEYSLPRLKRLWTHLNREVGTAKAGIGVRGPGEKQIETDRRLVRKRIRDLKRSLETMQAHRVRQTRARGRYFTAALVGYTNAGKSTLLRALTGADVLIEDRLFATLDTTTRAWEISPGRRIFLSDTVGFIRDLPHHLVSSFLATLEEARFADLLIHVVDAADPDVLDHIDVVDRTLYEIGAGGVPRIHVLNQVDRVQDTLTLRLLEERLPEGLKTSALEGTGISALRDKVHEYVTRRHVDVVIEGDPGNGRLLSQLREWGEVREVTYPDSVVRVDVRIAPRYLARIENAGGRVIEDGTAPADD